MISWGPLGLLLLAALDSAGIPLVGGVDALLVTVSIVQPQQAYLSAFCAIAGSLAGSFFLFGIARKGGEAWLAKYIASGRGKQLHNWFERYGLLTVFVPAVSPIPMPMKIPIFCAGALEVRWSNFIAVMVVARTIRYLALAYLGMKYGAQTFPFLKRHVWAVMSIVILLAVCSIVLLRIVDRRQAAATVLASPEKSV